MLTTKRKPVTPGEILVEEFLEPLGVSQTQLAEQAGLPRKHVNELCRGRRAVTADTALILSRVFGTSPEFWLNTQHRTDIWEALNTPGAWFGYSAPSLSAKPRKAHQALRLTTESPMPP